MASRCIDWVQVALRTGSMGDGDKVARAGRQERTELPIRTVRAGNSDCGCQAGEAGSKRARNSVAVSQRTSQSPTSASRSGSAIGASRSARRAAVSASKRAAACRRSSARCCVNTLCNALCAAFPEPLLGPFSDPFDQRHTRLLQRPYRRHRRSRRRQPSGNLPYPIHERALQLVRAPIRQPASQRLHRPHHVLRRPTLLQPRHRAQQVAVGQIVRRHPLPVKQVVALGRLIRRQPRPNRRDEGAQVRCCGPRLAAVVEHHRQHGREPLASHLGSLIAHQFLVQQTAVGEDAQRHPVQSAQVRCGPSARKKVEKSLVTCLRGLTRFWAPDFATSPTLPFALSLPPSARALGLPRPCSTCKARNG